LTRKCRERPAYLLKQPRGGGDGGFRDGAGANADVSEQEKDARAGCHSPELTFGPRFRPPEGRRLGTALAGREVTQELFLWGRKLKWCEGRQKTARRQIWG
jgi:hypothetical protein